MNRNTIYKEIEGALGTVPGFMQLLPDSTLGAEWELFKASQMETGAIPNKYRELIGVAISGVTKCRYCAFYHTELAKLNGATEAEIEDAVHFAKQTAGWSTYVNGLQVDFEAFQQDVLEVCEHVRKTQGSRMAA